MYNINSFNKIESEFFPCHNRNQEMSEHDLYNVCIYVLYSYHIIFQFLDLVDIQIVAPAFMFTL